MATSNISVRGNFYSYIDKLFFYKKPHLSTGLFVSDRVKLYGQGVVDGAECVADLGAEQAHYSNNDDGNERKNDSVLDEALAFFFRCE